MKQTKENPTIEIISNLVWRPLKGQPSLIEEKKLKFLAKTKEA